MNKISFNPFPILETNRLILRKMKIEDDGELFLTRKDPEVSKYIDRKLYETVKEATDYIEKINKGIENNEWIMWAIVMKEEGKYIGNICIWNISDDKYIGEIGYELMREYHHMGIMDETLKCVINYAVNTLNFKKLKAYGFPENERSLKLLERNGFKREEKLLTVDKLGGGTLDLIDLTLLNEKQ